MWTRNLHYVNKVDSGFRESIENDDRLTDEILDSATQIKIEHNYVIWVALWEECRHQKFLIWICGKVATIRKEVIFLPSKTA